MSNVSVASSSPAEFNIASAGGAGPSPSSSGNAAANGFVLLAIVTVAVALGVGFRLQLGMSVWLATFNAASLLLGMVGLHLVITSRLAPAPRRAKVQTPAKPPIQPSANASPRAAGDARRTVARTAPPTPPASADAPAHPVAQPLAARVATGAVDGAATEAPAAEMPAARRASDEPAQEPAPAPASARPASDARGDRAQLGPDTRGDRARAPIKAAPPAAADATQTLASSAPATPPAPEPARPQPPADLTSVRQVPAARATVQPDAPKTSALPAPATARRATAAPATTGATELPTAPQAKAPLAVKTEGIENKVETVQRLVRQLADQVNAQERAALRGASSAALTESAISASVAALRSVASPAPAPTSIGRLTGEPNLEAQPQLEPATTTTTSALGSLRPGEPLLGLADQTAPGPIDLAAARLVALTEAIETERLDVLLEPIRGLGAPSEGHYEVSIRLRQADGEPLTGATPAELRGTGLLPRIDRIRIARTAALARRLDERGKTGGVFSEFSGESLVDIDFLSRFAAAYEQHSALSAQLVLSFTQDEVRGFGNGQWVLLGDMRDLGFRFALSDVTTLDMDFDGLVARGFRFAKLDASVFLEGLPADGGALVPSNDICGHLAGAGLTLIVGHIDDEATLARILGFGVLFGQGMLFGGPRTVKAEMLDPKPMVAA